MKHMPRLTVMSIVVTWVCPLMLLSQHLQSLLSRWPLLANSGPHPSSWRPTCHHCGVIGHLKARYFKLHPELRQTVYKNRPPNSSSPWTAAIAETTGNSAALSDFSRLQAQIGQLQDQLGSLAARAYDTPITPIATIATGTPTAFSCQAWRTYLGSGFRSQ